MKVKDINQRKLDSFQKQQTKREFGEDSKPLIEWCEQFGMKRYVDNPNAGFVIESEDGRLALHITFSIDSESCFRVILCETDDDIDLIDETFDSADHAVVWLKSSVPFKCAKAIYKPTLVAYAKDLDSLEYEDNFVYQIEHMNHSDVICTEKEIIWKKNS